MNSAIFEPDPFRDGLCNGVGQDKVDMTPPGNRFGVIDGPFKKRFVDPAGIFIHKEFDAAANGAKDPGCGDGRTKDTEISTPGQAPAKLRNG